MKSKFTILGCGSSLGSPWITNYRGNLKQSPKNLRTRCCAHIQKGNLSVCIDTSPDIKYQFLKNKIKNLDSIIYTHEHADQTAGIFEMRPFYWKNKSKIPIYGSRRTITALKKSYRFCFFEEQGYKPIMKANIIDKSFSIRKNNIKLIDIFNNPKLENYKLRKSMYPKNFAHPNEKGYEIWSEIITENIKLLN